MNRVEEHRLNLARDHRTAGIKVIVLGSLASLVVAYWAWVWFSYLFVPFQPPPYEIQLKIWQLNGYYKVQPGKYQNPQYGTSYTINSKGFRGPEFEATRTRRTRIVALGESSTMGLESGEEETWPSRLQAALSQEGFDVEVVNGGFGGSISRQHRALVGEEIIGYRPDLIVYYAGRNDHAIETVERYPGPRWWPRGRWNFLRHWLLFKRVQARMLVLKTIGIDVDDILPWSNHGWVRDYSANLEAILGLARRAGVRMAIVTEALNYPPAVFDAVVEGAGVPEVARRLSMRDPEWTLFLRQVDLLRVQKRIAARYDNASWVDVHRIFRDAKRDRRVLFYDDVHLTREGNDLLGRSVAAAIGPHLAAKDRAMAGLGR